MRHALESFFKRRFFVVHLALLTVAAFLCATTASAVIGHVVSEKLEKSASDKQKTASRFTPRQTGTTRDFMIAANANIFEGKREVVVEAPPVEQSGPPPGEDGTCETAPKTSLRLRLVGTVVFEMPEYSLASIMDESKGNSTPAEMYSINDCVEQSFDAEDPNSKLAPKPAPCSRVGDGALVRRIEASRVCIWNETDHRMEYIAIDEPPEKGASSPIVSRREPTTTSSRPPRAIDDIGSTIKKTGENSWEVGQSDIDKALNNLSELSTQARIVPAFEGGKTIGFKLFSIRPGSLYSKIGLQNGDIITRINGYEMSSPEKGLEIYTKLKDAKNVTVDVKRRGTPKTLDYSITQ